MLQGSEGPSARKRTVRNENKENVPAISGGIDRIYSVASLNKPFIAFNHDV
jgi:hypothetical protein